MNRVRALGFTYSFALLFHLLAVVPSVVAQKKAEDPDWAELDKLVAESKRVRTELEAAWVKILPQLEELAIQRQSAADKPDQLKALDMDLAQLLKLVGQKLPAEEVEDAPEDTESPEATALTALINRLTATTDSVAAQAGPKDAKVKAARTKLEAARQERNSLLASQTLKLSRKFGPQLAQTLQSSRDNADKLRQRLEASRKALETAEQELEKATAQKPSASATAEELAEHERLVARKKDAVDKAAKESEQVESRLDIERIFIESAQQAAVDRIRAIQLDYQRNAPAGPGVFRNMADFDKDDAGLAVATHLQVTLRSEEGIARLALAKAVTHLDVVADNFEYGAAKQAFCAKVLRAAVTSPNLQNLVFSFNRASYSSEMIQSIALAPKLVDLTLEGDWDEPAALTELGKLKVQRVTLKGRLPDKPVAGRISALSGVQQLGLMFRNWPADEKLASALAALPNLYAVSLVDFDAPSCKTILASKSLREVRAYWVDAEILRLIASCKQLSRLELWICAIETSHLDELAGVSSLKYLHFCGCYMLDEFAALQLRKFNKLQSIELTGSSVPDWSVRVLRKHMPKCRITN